MKLLWILILSWVCLHAQTTQEYIANLPVRIPTWQERGSDYLSPFLDARFRLVKDNPDAVRDYDFAVLEAHRTRIAAVDRLAVLREVFTRVTANATTHQEKHLAVLEFLQRSFFHNNVIQPMHSDGSMVQDPLLLLDFSEGRCGHVARAACDLFAAAGYKTRLVQLTRHVIAEIQYDGAWHYLDADLFSSAPVVVSGKIPSALELSQNPALLDAVPSLDEIRVREYGKQQLNLPYPGYFYFNRVEVPNYLPVVYVKTATPAQAQASKWYGWNYYVTQAVQLVTVAGPIRYQPDPPRVTAQGRILEWECHDQDGDVVFYRVYVSPVSRGWTYRNWHPSMWEHLCLEPPGEVYETGSSSFVIPGTDSCYVTVCAVDQYGLDADRRVFPASEEIRIP